VRPPRRAVRVGAALCGILLAALLIPLAGLSAHSALAADDPIGSEGNVSVSVTDGSTPKPSSSSTAGQNGTGSGGSSGGSSSGGSGGSSSGGSSTGGSGQGGTGGGTGSSTAQPSEITADGVLYVGGLESSTAMSLDPGEGYVTLWFTVRNTSKSTIDATASFWMTSFFDNEIDAVDAVPVTALKPDETRVVTAQLHRGGQWILLNAHVTLTPPDSVDGTKLSPVTRDAIVLLFPWLLAIIAVVILGGLLAWRLIRGTSAAAVAPVVADAA
jgi:hypothetical protein